MSHPGKTKEEMLAARAHRAEEDEKLKERLFLEELTLEDKFSETMKRGVDFEIIVTPKGCLVLKKPDFLVVKRFNAVPNEKRSEEDVFAFVTPCILSPAQDVVRPLFTEHPGLAWVCCAEALKLSNLGVTLHEGKS
jgi:hypothetical protein